MSRNFIVFFIAWVITRLFYWLIGFNPIRDLPAVLGYPIDLGIWLLVSFISYWFLGVLGIGRKAR
jgi:hypothetical protein